ncbi:MAG: nicotinate phosphoribosyltransferase [Candidatus Eremiobacteraeota bacterium]|nr:nicotinate phosphoribosyltransferase [Candidatus Eremiobacteraeota bacterium]
MEPANAFVRPLLTDLYQLTMAYAYWKSGRHEAQAVFDLFFRKNPFGGEFTIFAGLEEVLRLVDTFRFTGDDIAYLKEGVRLREKHLSHAFEEGVSQGYLRKTASGYEQKHHDEEGRESWIPVEPPRGDEMVPPLLARCDSGFFDWLASIDCSRIKIHAIPEGTMVFPRIPLVRVEGPLAVAQLLETTLLSLVNYPSLVATKAARLRLAAGSGKTLMEFGLRRAQGPDGAMSASRYSYIGGFDSTSNVLAGQLFGIPTRGTHAHSFVSTFLSLDEVTTRTLAAPDGTVHDLVALALRFREELEFTTTNEGELAAFLTYAQAFPEQFLALVDTYDTLKSGVPNFICAALALMHIGYKPMGIRLDSGDLSYFSKKTRDLFRMAGERYGLDLSRLTIVASNDLDESTLLSLNQQGHEIDVFGIGTHLVTCYGQPALGGVYKLVVVNDHPRIKISQDVSKVTIPGKKKAYRLIGSQEYPLLDIMMGDEEAPPGEGKQILCRHPFDETKRAYVVPQRVLPLHRLVWDGRLSAPFESLQQTRAHTLKQLATTREDHIRALNPTPYKVSVSDTLYRYIHKLWMDEAPIPVIH